MPRPAVLIADDHLMFAELTGRYLATQYEVPLPVTELDELMPRLDEVHPDVLLLDISFGKRSSLPLVARIVRRHRDTRIVMVTGHADRRMMHTALDAGARGYVLKDGGPADLMVAIRAVLAGERYIDPELRSSRPVPRYRLLQPLSARQHEVLMLLRRGSTEQMIADALKISLSTAEKHVLAIKRRLGLERTKRTIPWSTLRINGLPGTAAVGRRRK